MNGEEFAAEAQEVVHQVRRGDVPQAQRCGLRSPVGRGLT